MKRIVYLTLIFSSLIFMNCKSENPSGTGTKVEEGVTVVKLTNETFKKLVFNYDKNTDWNYEGRLPAIIDFYADWCSPCRQLSPVVEEIAREYAGKIVVYKVDTEKEMILSRKLGISGLPTLLFIPSKGKPTVSMGLIPKENLVKTINEVLLIK
jgi:thioredoxin 1